ncbi:hypothetical protein ACIOHB_36475 [Streptomyces microflavus]|uniref:hypothetical protein n=1 Tax=Streptomyces microflavus TaxID=1919 RepID=UPI0033BE8BCB
MLPRSRQSTPLWRRGFARHRTDSNLKAAVEPAPELGFADVDDDQELVLGELTRGQVLDWRNRASADHQLVFDRIDGYGELSAQRLFTRAFVVQVQRLSGLGHLDGHTTWVQA